MRRSCTSGWLDRVSESPLSGEDNTSEVLLAFEFAIGFCFTTGGLLVGISLLGFCETGEAGSKSSVVDMLVDGFRGEFGWDALRLLLLPLVMLDNGLDSDMLGLWIDERGFVAVLAPTD